MSGRFLHLVRHGEASGEGRLSEAGRRQAALLGSRLSGLPIAAIHHGPLPRARETASLISARLPGVPMSAAQECGDYVPPVPDPSVLPPVFVDFLAGVTPEEYAEGARLAREALTRFAVPSDSERHELIVTHSFLIGWFVRDALDAPEWRWIGLNAANCGLTTIRYRNGRPPTLVTVNDQAHLPEELRWTGLR